MDTNKITEKGYPEFTQDMKKTHKLLMPQMAPIHFDLIAACLRREGYDMEILTNEGKNVVDEGLRYVHNDACYPALLVIGQFIDALKSGKYDLDATALVITQTGGGCRASNYIHMLRKALVKAGLPNIPVASLNFSGLDSGLKFSLPVIYDAISSILIADQLMCLSNQTKPYEVEPGASMQLVRSWLDRLSGDIERGKHHFTHGLKKIMKEIAMDFEAIQLKATRKIKVGIVGEIYVKYSSLGNNALEEFLLKEGCEVSIPGLLGFIQYCLHNTPNDIDAFGGSIFVKTAFKAVLAYLDSKQRMMIKAIERNSSLNAPHAFDDVARTAENYIGLGAKMGEGWLLTGEMVELVKSGFPNIICAQPFGCLPNHVVGKGMISKIRRENPTANIMPIDYDPGSSKVNQENRIKLMLASAERTPNTSVAKKALNPSDEGELIGVDGFQSI